jgi:hypothetical protein
MPMTKNILFLLLLSFLAGSIDGFSQSKSAVTKPRVEVLYFHPTDRCPIDQSIEENARKLMQTTFAKEVKEGTIRFQVINTDDKSQAKTVARFEINAQALYIVAWPNGREVKNDLTHFAFSTGQSNPAKFRSGLKEEIEKALQDR